MSVRIMVEVSAYHYHNKWLHW